MKKIFPSITQNAALLLWLLFLMSKLQAVAQAPVKVWDAYYANRISTMAGMVTDAYGNVYVTGVTDSANYESIITIKYNSQGVQQWLSVYSGQGNAIAARALAIDVLGNIIVAGTDNTYYLAIKYNNQGVLQWSATGYYGTCNAMTVDASGNVYLTGRNNTDAGAGTMKYNAAGVLQWEKTYYLQVGIQYYPCSGTVVATDNEGNVYVAGPYEQSDFTNNMMVIQYLSNGTQEWIYNDGSYPFVNVSNGPYAIAVDNTNGTLYIAATAPETGNVDGGFWAAVAAFSTGGQLLWPQWCVPGIPGGPNTNINATSGADMALNPGSDPVITGFADTTFLEDRPTDFITFQPLSQASHGLQWSSEFSSSGYLNNASTNIKLDEYGNSYVTGYSTSATYATAINTVKYNTSGARQWQIYDSLPTCTTQALAVSSDGSNIYVAGTVNNQFYTVRYGNLHPDIVIGNVLPSPVCAGGVVQVNYLLVADTTTGDFILLLSDSTGNFTSPDTLSTFEGADSGTISIALPENISSGGNYRMRIVSNTINGSVYGNAITIRQGVTPVVNVSANPWGTICPQTPVTFSAQVVNGGTAPVYQWFINGAAAGNTSSITNNNPGNDDSIQVLIVSNAVCALTDSAVAGITVQLLPSASSNIAGTVCPGQSLLGYNTTGVFTDTFYNASVNGCDSIRTLNLTVLQLATSNIVQSVCDGESYLGYDTTGTYVDTLYDEAANGCDSIRTLNLTVLLPATSTIMQSVCSGESYLGYSTEGIYVDTLYNEAANGCDSIRTLNLTVLPLASSNIAQTICAGESYSGYSTGGVYVDTLLNEAANGCDSIRTLNLTVLPLAASTIEQSICAGESYLGHDAPGTYIDTLYNAGANGCDSIRALNLMVLPLAASTIQQGICPGESYLGYDATGTYIDTLANAGANGCDSVRTLNLTVFQQAASNISQAVCSGQSYLGHDSIGIYIDTLLNASVNGCDSVRTLNLTVQYVITTTISQSICNGDNYYGHDTSGMYIDSFIANGGCDSVRTLNLAVLSPASSNISQSVCAGQSYLGYSSTGTYVDTLSNAAINGCDSIRTINLTVQPAITTSLDDSVCEGITYPFKGENLSAAGTYHDTLQSAGGCDSLVTLYLTINSLPAPSVTRSNDTVQTQSFASYQWLLNGAPVSMATEHSILITQNGDYSVVVTNINGCSDTSAALNVTNLAIAAISGNYGVKLYPNPNNGNFILEFTDNATREFEITDAIGSLIVASQKITRQKNFDLNALAAGVYILQIRENGQVKSLKFSIVK